MPSSGCLLDDEHGTIKLELIMTPVGVVCDLHVSSSRDLRYDTKKKRIQRIILFCSIAWTYPLFGKFFEAFLFFVFSLFFFYGGALPAESSSRSALRTGYIGFIT